MIAKVPARAGTRAPAKAPAKTAAKVTKRSAQPKPYTCRKPFARVYQFKVTNPKTNEEVIIGIPDDDGRGEMFGTETLRVSECPEKGWSGRRDSNPRRPAWEDSMIK